ncbi:MAG TPA: lysophospholipid acyltransferase family protein [Alloacidobacterium sp.]|nr:lysophospholipid acyltransferase family protein [Alloacidobacterium sp.]
MKTRRPLGPRPNPLPLANRALSFFIQAPAFFSATAFFGSLSMAASLTEKDGRRQHRIAQAWARASMAISGCPVTLLGAENLRKHKVAVYACNHLSYMDTPVIFSNLPFQFRIVARHDLWKLPFIGWHLNRSGQIPVNVDNPRASIASLSGAVRTLKSGMPLFIFPEGGRSRSGHPSAFLNGPAFMAIRAQVPMVPMALIGTHELLPIHTGQFYPVPITLAVGEPIETTHYSMRQIDELTARLSDEICRLYYSHSYLEAPAHPSLAAITEIPENA